MEIVVVIGILAVLCSVSWTVFNNFQPALQLNALSRNLTSDLRYMQQMAVTEQINHGVGFSTTTNTYRLLRFSTTTQELANKALPLEISFCQIAGLSSGAMAIFNPYGAVLASGSICLVNSRGQNKIVEIKPSGFVKIQN